MVLIVCSKITTRCASNVSSAPSCLLLVPTASMEATFIVNHAILQSSVSKGKSILTLALL